MQFSVNFWCYLVNTAAICCVALTLDGCASPVDQYFQMRHEGQQIAEIEAEIKRKEGSHDSILEFSSFITPDHRNIAVSLIKPMIAVARCEGNSILISLPDEFVCEESNFWVYQPSQRILPPADLLLVSLRSTGLSVSSYSSLAEARHAGAKAAVLTVITRSDVTIWQLRDFYKQRNIDADDISKGALSRAIGTVKMHATIVRLDSGQILWKGTIQQVMERTVPSLPLADGRAKIESAAGTGGLELETYGLRLVVVESYTQAGRGLAKEIDKLLKEIIQ